MESNLNLGFTGNTVSQLLEYMMNEDTLDVVQFELLYVWLVLGIHRIQPKPTLLDTPAHFEFETTKPRSREARLS